MPLIHFPALLAGYMRSPAMPIDLEPGGPMSRTFASLVANNAITAWEQLESAGQDQYRPCSDDDSPICYLHRPVLIEADRADPGKVRLVWFAPDRAMVVKASNRNRATVTFNGGIAESFDFAAFPSAAVGVLVGPFLGTVPAMAVDEAEVREEVIRVLTEGNPPYCGKPKCCRSNPEGATMSTDDFPVKSDADTTAYRFPVSHTPAGDRERFGAGESPKPTMASLDLTRKARVDETVPFAKAEVKAAVSWLAWLTIGKWILQIVEAIIKAQDKKAAGMVRPPDTD